MKVVIPLNLDSERDADIVRWLEQQANRSAAIRDAIRAHIGQGVTLLDIYREIQDLKRRSFVAVQPGSGPEEPPEAAANLDKLLGL